MPQLVGWAGFAVRDIKWLSLHLLVEQLLVCQSAEGHQDRGSAGWQVLSRRLAAGENKAEDKAGVVTDVSRAGHLNCTSCHLPGSCAHLSIAPRHGTGAQWRN